MATSRRQVNGEIVERPITPDRQAEIDAAAAEKAARDAKAAERAAALTDTPADVNSVPALRAELDKVKAILRDELGL